MGLGSKIKGFFGRVWSGVKKGWSKAKEFIRNRITPIYEKAKPLINLIPGANVVTGVVDKILPAVNGVSDDAAGAIKQGVQYVNQKLNR